MSYLALSEWGDPCSSSSECPEIDYLCKDGECSPRCSSDAHIVDDDDSWWCECNDGFTQICVSDDEYKTGRYFPDASVPFLDRSASYKTCAAVAVASAVTIGALVYLVAG